MARVRRVDRTAHPSRNSLDGHSAASSAPHGRLSMDQPAAGRQQLQTGRLHRLQTVQRPHQRQGHSNHQQPQYRLKVQTELSGPQSHQRPATGGSKTNTRSEPESNDPQTLREGDGVKKAVEGPVRRSLAGLSGMPYAPRCPLDALSAAVSRPVAAARRSDASRGRDVTSSVEAICEKRRRRRVPAGETPTPSFGGISQWDASEPSDGSRPEWPYTGLTHPEAGVCVLSSIAPDAVDAVTPPVSDVVSQTRRIGCIGRSMSGFSAGTAICGLYVGLLSQLSRLISLCRPIFLEFHRRHAMRHRNSDPDRTGETLSLPQTEVSDRNPKRRLRRYRMPTSQTPSPITRRSGGSPGVCHG
jgi:hypothetical protein